MKKISLVVAVSQNYIIGDNNQLPWHLPNDLKHFKALTMGKPIIMGRKTYESIGKPLPGRQNIILTQQPDLAIAGCHIVHSVDEALNVAKGSEVMVIGGGEIFRLFYPKASTVYITYVHVELSGSVSFNMDPSNWQEISREDHQPDEKHAYAYSFIKLIRSQ